jgi:HAD superfamily hydrolase (TIGR01549 family)
VSLKAVFFDVDFTLIYPGPTFRGEGYRAFGVRHGMDLAPSKFDEAVVSAAPLLDTPEETLYDDELYVAYTRHIIEQMGGSGPAADACAREVYAEWAGNQHFELYEEVPGVLRELAGRGVRMGLISNSHRCLASFQSHFELQGLISAAVSSSDHGLMKPHPSIFAAALQLAGVQARDAMMVGDSLRQDVEGGLGAGMWAALLHRAADPHPRRQELVARGVPIISSLTELARVL